MDYSWKFDVVFENFPLLLKGIQGTIFLSSVSIILCMILGLFVGLGRYSRNRFVYALATVYVEFFRDTPMLVQIMWFFFAFPIISPFEIDALHAAMLGITLNGAAYSAEIFRGGIQTIEPGQWEGAQAIGMTYSQTMIRIILPQAIKRMVPALTNRAIEITKGTTLASIVAYPEVLYQAKLIASKNFNPIEMYSVVAVAFFLTLYPVVIWTRIMEKRLGKGD
jgi:polar amino acid transport system permease protein